MCHSYNWKSKDLGYNYVEYTEIRNFELTL